MVWRALWSFIARVIPSVEWSLRFYTVFVGITSRNGILGMSGLFILILTKICSLVSSLLIEFHYFNTVWAEAWTPATSEPILIEVQCWSLSFNCKTLFHLSDEPHSADLLRKPLVCMAGSAISHSSLQGNGVQVLCSPSIYAHKSTCYLHKSVCNRKIYHQIIQRADYLFLGLIVKCLSNSIISYRVMNVPIYTMDMHKYSSNNEMIP